MPKGIYNRTPEILAKLKNNFGKEVGFSYWKGKHRSEDTKEKLKEYRTGKKHSTETIEKMKVSRKKRLSSGMKGKTHTEATKIAISKKLQGDKSHTWKGGVTPENEIIRHSVNIKSWRTTVYKRDNHTCRKCGQIGRELQAHHIQNFSDFKELRHDVDNGITFCKKCHQIFHKRYTKLNNTREQLDEFLVAQQE